MPDFDKWMNQSGQQNKAGPNTEILAILDRSGSMENIADDQIGGFNRFVQEQKNVPGAARMTMILFDHEYLPLYAGKVLPEVEPLSRKTYIPRGSTALFDAIGRTLNEQGARIDKEGWAEKVIVIIVTDGLENASKEFTSGRIKEMVKEREAKGWSFIYTGANQDAFLVASAFGMANMHTQSYAATAAGATQNYTNLEAAVRNLRTK